MRSHEASIGRPRTRDGRGAIRELRAAPLARKIDAVRRDRDCPAGPVTARTERRAAPKRLRRLRGTSQEYEAYANVGGKIATLWLQKRPLSELQAEPDRIAKVPLMATNAAAAKWARPDKATIVVVGDRAKIEEKLKALNVGEVVLLDVEGRPVPQ